MKSLWHWENRFLERQQTPGRRPKVLAGQIAAAVPATMLIDWVAPEPQNGGQDDRAQRLKAASYALIASGIIVAVFVALASGVRVTVQNSGRPILLTAAALLTAAIITRSAPRSRIADCLAALSLGWLSAVIGAAIALGGLRFRFPAADAALKAMDAAIGIDGTEIVRLLVDAGQWVFDLMAPAYAYTFQIVGLGVVGLFVIGNRIEAWRAVFCFVGTLISSCAIAIFIPAKGLGVWMDTELLNALPEGAVTYAFAAFDKFYRGADPELSMDALQGVVTFPSFHFIMGLIVLAMCRGNWLALVAGGGWFSFMALSTLPYGGHYVVDLVGGTFVWAFWFMLSERISRDSVGLSFAAGR